MKENVTALYTIFAHSGLENCLGILSFLYYLHVCVGTINEICGVEVILLEIGMEYIRHVCRSDWNYW